MYSVAKIKLDRLQKIAFARIITDLIEADFMVETKEMDFFEKIISKEYFSITEAMLKEAKRMDFAKAVSILKELDSVTQQQLLSTLKHLAMSDGTCVPLEAIQIFTLEQALKHYANVYSIPSSAVNIENMSVIYIENETDTITNKIIQNNFEVISNHLKLAGFHFVYVPHIVDDYRLLPSDYLRKVVKYMIPSASEDRISKICNNICELTTKRFCQDLLYKKLGLNLLDAKPSLLIKINESDIIEQYDVGDADRVQFSNFLQIEVGEEILSEIHQWVDQYMEMINSVIFVENKPNIRKFLYHGFHRSLFDLIAYGKQKKEYRLVFDVSKHNALVYFESVDESKERIVLKLTPQETTLFLMIAKKSLAGVGLDWREQIPSDEKKALMTEYNEIYKYIGKGNTTTEYKDKTQVHHIKNRIKLLQCIANADMFIPEHMKGDNVSVYKIKASDDYVKIIG